MISLKIYAKKVGAINLDGIILNESDMMLNEAYKDVIVNGNPSTLLEGISRILSYDRPMISFMESAALESMYDELKDGATSQSTLDFQKELPAYTPYFTPSEYRDLFPNKDIADYDYVILHDCNKYFKAISSLYEMKEKDPYTEQACNNKLLELGWNPYIDPTYISMTCARNRQIKWLKENKSPITIVDVSKFSSEVVEESVKDSILEPIYICLSYTGTIFGDIINWWKKSTYSHSALSLDEKLDKMYSFNRNVQTGESGFMEEGIQDYKNPKMNNDANLCVIGVFVSKEQKKKIKETIEWYKKNKKLSSYSFKNIANIVFNRTTESVYSLQMVCSQFVGNILKIANVDITRKANNLVAPQDFVYTASPENKVYILYEGLKSKYKPSQIKNKVNALLRSVNKAFPKIDKKNLALMMKNPTLESFLIKSDDKFTDHILTETIGMLTPSSVIMEAKRIPVGFTKKGDIYIDTPKDLEAEYQEAHKLLSVYDESNIQGIKHELARLFWVVSIIDKRISKIDDKNSKEYKDLIHLKARAMNDFTKYMKIVNKEEKNFDFTNYLKHTEYYDKTVVIGNDTLKYSGSFIKKAISLLGL